MLTDSAKKKLACYTLFSVFLQQALEVEDSVTQVVLEAIRRATNQFGEEAVAQMILDTFTDDEVKAVLRRRHINRIKEAISA